MRDFGAELLRGAAGCCLTFIREIDAIVCLVLLTTFLMIYDD